MGGVVLPVAAIGDAGRLASRVAGDLSGIDVGTPAVDIATALPGSRSAQVAGTAAQQWRAEFGAITTGMQGYGRNLGETATAYQEQEQALLRSVADVAGGLPGPVGMIGSALGAATSTAAGPEAASQPVPAAPVEPASAGPAAAAGPPVSTIRQALG